MIGYYIDKISVNLVPLVLSGNCGVSPFLTLLLITSAQWYNPDLLAMGDDSFTKKLLSNIIAMIVLGVLAIVELAAKCFWNGFAFIPKTMILNSAPSSFWIFLIIPLASVLASVATFGLSNLPTLQNEIEFNNYYEDDKYYDDIMDENIYYDGENNAGNIRNLALSITLNTHAVLQPFLIIIGGFLAISLHLLKSIPRENQSSDGETSLRRSIFAASETLFCISTIVVTMYYHFASIPIIACFIVAALINLSIRRRRRAQKNAALLQDYTHREAKVTGIRRKENGYYQEMYDNDEEQTSKSNKFNPTWAIV
mmetsp:Transcript_9285/g.13165  ORF Transcript_9285/g.13165 Transcript_9285/m.13165 type:complete len:311 (+) Transcript_9285:17-949(+)